MLDKPPTEAEWLSWVYAGTATLLIFLTVPFARTVQAIVANYIGRGFFLYVVAFAAIAAGYAAFANLKRRSLSVSAYLWLFGIGTAFAIYSYSLRENPEEAIHFVEYGALSLLVYRALVHSVRDYSVFITATVIVGTVGVVDEWIQWMTPSRVWDLRDIQINFVAGGLVQLGIFAGLRPSIVAGSPNPASLRTLCRTAALAFFFFGLTLVNTPERIARYASDVPTLSFLLDKKSVMVEYGYLYHDPEVGLFRSRFTIEKLAKNDRSRGGGAAKIMDEYISEENFSTFQKKYSVPRDAYIHEVGIHLFRRNRYLSRALSEVTSRSEFYNVAYRENRILEIYFPTTLNQSKHLWTEEMRNEIESAANKELVYESPVAHGLITRVNKKQVLTGILLVIGNLLLLAAYFGRRMVSSPARSSVNEE